jgi:hypothetical protein
MYVCFVKSGCFASYFARSLHMEQYFSRIMDGSDNSIGANEAF